MTDLSAYSDAELMAIAGGGSSSDLSGYSDSELMQIAGVQPQPAAPVSIRQQIETEAPWYTRAASGAMSGLAGLGDLAQTALSYTPFGSGLRNLPEEESIGNLLRGGLDMASGVEGSTEVGKGGYAHKLGEYLPGVAIGGATTAAKGSLVPFSGGVKQSLGSIAKLLGADAYFGTAGYAGKELGGPKGELAANLLSLAPMLAAQKAAPLLSDAGRKMELSAFGAGKSRVNQAINRMPDILDETGDFQNPISEAIASFRDANKTADSMEGAVLMKELQAQTDGLIGDLYGKLAKAETKQTEAIVPEFKKTSEYIKGLAGVSKKDGLKIVDEAIEATINNTDGTLSSLQNEKVKLGQAIKDGAWGSDTNAALKTNIYKRIRSDLRTTIEDAYGSLTGESPEVIKKLNQSLGQREGLYPLFKDIISAGESRNPLGWLMQNWRTSGGFGVPALIAAGSLGGVPAAAVPIAGALASTPGGRLKIADFLRKAPEGVQNLTKAGALGALSGQTSQLSKALQGLQGEILPRKQQDSQSLKTSGSKSTSFNSTLDKALTQAEKQMELKAPQVVEIKRTSSKGPSENFVEKEEGGQRVKAYNPPAKGSGITVATGVDLGQWSKKDLEDAGVSDKTIFKIQKYLGAKDAVARKLLKEKPLTLTKAEADELDEAVSKDIYGTVEEKLKDKGVSFAKLPEEAQTDIKSISYNFGKNFDEKLPSIWKAIIKKDWATVQDLLINTKWKQKELIARRKREADLLSRIV